MAIECPEFIDLGNFKCKYTECNDYQKPIYLVLAQEVKVYNELQKNKTKAKEVEMYKKLGVIEFLCGRILAYKGIVKVSSNIYEGPIA